MKWVVYYDTGERVTDSTPPQLVPTRGVQIIAREDADMGRAYLKTCDYYWWVGGERGWEGGDVFGLWDYLDSPGWKRVLFGRTIGNHEYREIEARVLADDYLPRKSAWRKGERRW